MSNVVNLFEKKSPEIKMPNNEVLPEAVDYIRGFYDWAQERGVDTDDINFKYDAATILTIVQAVLLKARAA